MTRSNVFGPSPPMMTGGCGRREGDERVVAVPVLLRQGRAAGPRAAPARRDVRVLREPHRLEAALLEGARDLVGADRVLGRKDHDTEVHGQPSVRLTSARTA